MDIFSHILWAMLLFRNRLWREEALFFAILPDIGFLFILMYVFFGTPMNVGWNQAMVTMPDIYRQFYFLMHSFVALGIAAVIVWRLRPKMLPALWGWFLHICMDIPAHDGEFGTRFLYPIFPDFYISGINWTDIRILPVAYLLLANFAVYSFWREGKKHRMGSSWKRDWIDRLDMMFGELYRRIPAPVSNPRLQAAGNIINKNLTSAANAACGYFRGAFDRLSGKDQGGAGQGENQPAESIIPPEAGR